MLGSRFRCFAALALLAAPTACAAAPLRLADVLDEARRQSPAIAAARERADATSFRPAEVSAYDDPTLGWEIWNAPESFAVDRADQNIVTLSQRVPFPGKRSLAGGVAARDAVVAARRADAVELQVLASVRRTYAALWLAHRKLAIYERDRELVASLAEIVERKYVVGQASQPEVLRAQMEGTQLVTRVATQELAIEERSAELRALLSRTADEPLGIPEDPPAGEPDVTPDVLTERALAERPEVAAAAAVVTREDEKVRLARLDYFPDFELAISRFANARRADGFGAMASLSLPIVNKSKYDAALGEAEARLRAARADLRRQQDRVRKDVELATARRRAASLRVDLYRTTHVPQAEQALAASRIAYQTGKIDFRDLVDGLRAIERVHVEHVEAEADLQNALADLERAVGGPITGGER